MNIAYSARFKKIYNKLPQKIQSKFDEKVSIFKLDEFDPILNNHKLHGEYVGYRSVNITGNIRAIYKKISEENYYFLGMGTHSELYS